MIKLRIMRYSTDADSTLSVIHDVTARNTFLCYGLEDEHRTKKVYAETRIRAGVYPLALRQFGGFYARYSARWEWNKPGMLWIQDVPEFTDVLIHCGNTDDDTAGCLLVGSYPSSVHAQEQKVLASWDAYEGFYKYVQPRCEPGSLIEMVDYA